MQSRNEAIIKTLVLSGILVFLFILLSQTVALLFGGFDDPNVLKQFNFYQNIGIGFLVGVLIFIFLEIFVMKGDSKYGNGNGFSSMGEFPSLSFFKRFTMTQMTLLSIIFALSLGLLNQTLISQTSFGADTYTGINPLPKEQFGTGSSILFSTFQVPTPENLGAAFVVVFTLFGLRYASRKFNFSKTLFAIMAWMLIIVFVALFGVAWHNSVYPGQEITQMKVAGFWGVGGAITLATGSFIPFLMIHTSNNLFYDLGKHFSKELLFIFFLVVIIGLIILYFYTYKGRLTGANKKTEAVLK